MNERELIERLAAEIEKATAAGDEQRARKLADLQCDVLLQMLRDQSADTARAAGSPGSGIARHSAGTRAPRLSSLSGQESVPGPPGAGVLAWWRHRSGSGCAVHASPGCYRDRAEALRARPIGCCLAPAGKRRYLGGWRHDQPVGDCRDHQERDGGVEDGTISELCAMQPE